MSVIYSRIINPLTSISLSGSSIDASASLDFYNTNRPYHIRAVNSHLILSSTAGSQTTISGNVNISGELLPNAGLDARFILTASIPTQLDVRYLTTASFSASLGSYGDPRYILTSSASEQRIISNVFVSGNLGISGSIYSPFTHLTLSSSGGSTVTVSGALSVKEGTLVARTTSALTNVYTSAAIFRHRSSGDMAADFGVALALSVEDTSLTPKYPVYVVGSRDSGGDDYGKLNLIVNNNSVWDSGLSIYSDSKSGLGKVSFKPSSSLDVSGSVAIGAGYYSNNTSPSNGLLVQGYTGLNVGSATVAEVLQLSGNIRIDGPTSKVYANASHLILSSAAGSRVTVSGNLNITGDLVPNTGLDNRFILTSSIPTQLDVRYLTTASLPDQRFVLTSSYHAFTGSVNDFTASFSGTIRTFGDARYILTSSAVEQRIDSNVILSGNVGIVGSLYDVNSHLIISSSVGSKVTVSGALKISERAGSAEFSAFSASVGTTSAVIDTFTNTTVRAAKYLIAASSGSYFQAQEVLALQSGSFATLTRYAILNYGGAEFVGFDIVVTGSNVDLRASGTLPENTLKIVRTTVEV